MIKTALRSSSLMLALVIMQLVAFCQPDAVPSFVKDSIDNYVQRALTDWQIPGVAVCIVKDGKVVLMKGYGTTEMNGTDKVDENTLFMIGSNSKAFTATAIAMLDADKKLSLDDKVTKWIPEFKLDNKAAGEQALFAICFVIVLDSELSREILLTGHLILQEKK